MIQQELVDIVLMSASTSAELTLKEKLFERSPITPAGRANDASDVFVVRGGGYLSEPARPFRSAALDHLQCGHLDCAPHERAAGANFGLYSVTFNNRLDDDLRTLEEYKRFREEAERKGFRHFLEVFTPNAPHDLPPEAVPNFCNDHIARTLAGVAPAGRPVFLKIVYQGPRHDAGSRRIRSAFGRRHSRRRRGDDVRRVQTVGRSEEVRRAGRPVRSQNQLRREPTRFHRVSAPAGDRPNRAGRRGSAYHGVLEKLRIRPFRTLAEDLELRTNVMSYARTAQATVPALPEALRPVSASPPATTNELAAKTETPTPTDFRRMTPAQKLAWNQAERDRIWGKF
ncbi:MAG: hypothetical protein QM811_20715 [Pirellulales bacterium]